MKIVSLDIETNGLSPLKNQILEFAAIAFDVDTILEQLNGKPAVLESIESMLRGCDSVTYRVIPYNGELYNSSIVALDINKSLIEAIAHEYKAADDLNLLNPGYVYEEFLPAKICEFFYKHYRMDKVNILGKNAASFDVPFIEHYVTRFPTGDYKFKYHRRILDPAEFFTSAFDKCKPNLAECAKRACVNKALYAYGTLHNAYDDALLTAILYTYGLFRSPYGTKRYE